MAKNLDTPRNRQRCKGWCNTHSRDYDNSTNLAEGCADVFDLYENTTDYTIPEFIFEIAGEALPTT